MGCVRKETITREGKTLKAEFAKKLRCPAPSREGAELSLHVHSISAVRNKSGTVEEVQEGKLGSVATTERVC
jgi:hypothetical protein